jgi:hypothetical protein
MSNIKAFGRLTAKPARSGTTPLTAKPARSGTAKQSAVGADHWLLSIPGGKASDCVSAATATHSHVDAPCCYTSSLEHHR